MSPARSSRVTAWYSADRRLPVNSSMCHSRMRRAISYGCSGSCASRPRTVRSLGFGLIVRMEYSIRSKRRASIRSAGTLDGAMSVIEQLVDQIEARFADAEREMGDPQVITDRDRYAAAGRTYRQLEPAAKLAEEWRRAIDDEAGARELLEESGDDAEVRDLLANARADIERLEEEIRLAMVERDPNDDKDVIVEVQGAAGGAEADLWAGDLFRLLTRYAERRGFKTEILETADGHYTFAIKGDGAYSVFKWEGGTHRVQRVPATESQGRIHTSTATVSVLPEAEEVDVHVDEH